jgi:hypothetical protein
MALPERTIDFDNQFAPKDHNPQFPDRYAVNIDLRDPLYENVKGIKTEVLDTLQIDSDPYLREELFIETFNKDAQELQRLLDEEGWLPMAMMRETGDTKHPLVIKHQGNGFAWAEYHIKNRDLIDENGYINRDSIGLLFNEELAALAESMGMRVGQIPAEIMLKAYLQRINAFKWINNAEFLDRVEAMDQELQGGTRPHNSPIVNAEIEHQMTHHWKRDKDGIPISSPEDVFPSNLPPLEAISSHIYITRGSEDKMSRNDLVNDVILSPIGKHWRLETVVAPMPSSQGSVEYLSSAARMNALAVVPRNDQLANLQFRKDFTRKLIEDLDSRTVPGLDDEHQEKAKKMWKRNVAVAIGISNDEIQSMKDFMEMGVRSFRLYTVATDGRMKEQLEEVFKMMDAFKADHAGEDIELFVGQMTHQDQLGPAENYENGVNHEFYEIFKGFDDETIQKYIAGLYFGNGGGSMCSTASTGMGVNTLLLLHRFRNDPRFKNASFLIEGGITLKEFPLLQIGAHGESIASQAMTVESPGGELAYVGKKKTDWAFEIPVCGRGQIGEASLLSAQSEHMMAGNRMEDYTGLPQQTEGQASIKLINPNLPTVTQLLKERTKYLSQVMIKMGVNTIEQLHTIGTFQTAQAMESIFGPDWKKQRDLCSVRAEDYMSFSDHLRKILQAPEEVPWQTILKRAGLDPESEDEYYIIPSHLRLATPEQRIEGSPNGVGVTKMK